MTPPSAHGGQCVSPPSLLALSSHLVCRHGLRRDEILIQVRDDHDRILRVQRQHAVVVDDDLSGACTAGVRACLQ